MTTPIRPSLAQMLNPQPAAQKPTAQATAATGSFSNALAAQRAFFQQAAPKVTPATYTAADIAKAQPVQNAVPADASQTLKRPGSYLNIVI